MFKQYFCHYGNLLFTVTYQSAKCNRSEIVVFFTSACLYLCPLFFLVIRKVVSDTFFVAYLEDCRRETISEEKQTEMQGMDYTSNTIIKTT